MVEIMEAWFVITLLNEWSATPPFINMSYNETSAGDDIFYYYSFCISVRRSMQ